MKSTLSREEAMVMIDLLCDTATRLEREATRIRTHIEHLQQEIGVARVTLVSPMVYPAHSAHAGHPDKLATIKALRELLFCGLMEAKTIVEHLPHRLYVRPDHPILRDMRRGGAQFLGMDDPPDPA